MMRTIIQGAAFLAVTFTVAIGVTLGIAWFRADPEADLSTDTAATETPATPQRDPRTRPTEEAVDDSVARFDESEVSREVDDPRVQAINDQNVVTAVAVNAQLESLRQRDTELQLIQHDYRAEQELVGKLRDTIDARIELATRELVAAGLLQDTSRQQASLGIQDESPAVSVLTQPETAQTGLRRIVQMYERMPEEAPALIFQDMARDGLEDTVVLILSVMNERTMGRVLSNIAMNDAALASRLTVALGEMDDQKAQTEDDDASASPDTVTEAAAG